MKYVSVDSYYRNLKTLDFCVASIRKNIKLKPSEAIFFLVDNKIMDMKQNIGDFYSQYKLNKKPEDAYLYIQIIKEKTFGFGMSNVLWLEAIPLAVGTK